MAYKTMRHRYFGMRTERALRRAGFSDDNGDLDAKAIRHSFMNGSLSSVRNLGIQSLLEISRWLLDLDELDVSRDTEPELEHKNVTITITTSVQTVSKILSMLGTESGE